MGQHTKGDVSTQRALATYTTTAQRAASAVIGAYSTSFFAATGLLGRRSRRHLRNSAARVGVADDMVDGAASGAGISAADQLRALDQFETASLTALRTGFSSDLVIHAFAHTARWAGITADLVTPFFASMRADLLRDDVADEAGKVYDSQAHAKYVYGCAGVVGLMGLRVFLGGVQFPNVQQEQCECGQAQRGAGITADLVTPFFASMRADLLRDDVADEAGKVYDSQAHAKYVYGSAEVVGLMCLRVFLGGVQLPKVQQERAEYGARQLGAAFQNINFLRDIGDDTRRLGRHYLGFGAGLSAAQKDAWVALAREQLAAGFAAIELLPADARRAVRAAHNLFAELLARIDDADCATLLRRRMRVPNTVKTRIVVDAMFAGRSNGRQPA